MDIFLNKPDNTSYPLFLKAFIFNLWINSASNENLQSHSSGFNTRSSTIPPTCSDKLSFDRNQCCLMSTTCKNSTSRPKPDVTHNTDEADPETLNVLRK